MILRYHSKLSGPLMDRIDLFVTAPQLKYEKLAAPDEENSSEEIKKRVKEARLVQKERFLKDGILTNGEMQPPQMKKHCQLEQRAQSVLKQYVNSGKLSARGYHRVLKIARTIADLEASASVSYDHLCEALMYRARED